ncbi:nucleotidyltransferase family protein [Vagococcus elongatus]|uniref:nucleotidyltransferase family protein n=1 Tax=Vagococcus elongatus TaxID=180344 RepID=UPI00147687F4|nr:nucleotidyltransferase family protein [Vagococcus elongatus]
MDREAFISLIIADRDILTLLEIIETLDLPQVCLCAGTIRTHVWDTLSGKTSNYAGDVDIAFFDPSATQNETAVIEEFLKKNHPQFDWEVKNQAHMHLSNDASEPYGGVVDALGKFPETCTAVGIYKTQDEFKLLAPHGIEDILNFVVRPTPYFLKSPQRMKKYYQRQEKKQWHKYWERIQYR